MLSGRGRFWGRAQVPRACHQCRGQAGADWGRKKFGASVCLSHHQAATQTHCALAHRQKKFKHQFYTSGRALQPQGMAVECAPTSEQGAEHGWKPGVMVISGPTESCKITCPGFALRPVRNCINSYREAESCFVILDLGKTFPMIPLLCLPPLLFPSGLGHTGVPEAAQKAEGWSLGEVWCA